MAILFSGNPDLAVGVSGGLPFSSSGVNIGMLNSVSFDIDFTTQLSGTFFIEVTNKSHAYKNNNMQPDDDAIWKPLKSSVITNGLDPAGNAFIWADFFTAAKFIRIRFAPTLGSAGTFNARFYAKSQG